MNDDQIRVFLVDDHPMVRTGLAAMIAGEPDLVLVGEAGDGREALDAIVAAAPDVALIDLAMPRMDGATLIAELTPRLPQTRFVVLSSLLDPGAVDRVIDAGAHGYLLKNASAHDLAQTIRAAASGRRHFAPEVADVLVTGRQQRRIGADLTQRERELLALMAKGMSNREIAESRVISVPTVKFHVTNILTKLYAENRTEAVMTAIKYGLVPRP